MLPLNRPLRLVVFASGSGSNFEAIQTAILTNELNAEIVCLISDKKNAYVHKRAKRLNIKSKHFTHQEKDVYEQMILDYLSQYEFDYIVCAGYMRIIGPTLLNVYQNKIINIHPSDLPKYKGLNAVQQALDAKEEEIGISVHYVDETLDGGSIIKQMTFPIFKDMSKEDIETILHKYEHQLYVDVLKELQGDKMRRALISVSDKQGVVEFAKGLIEQGFEIISTGNTYKTLVAHGVSAIEVAEVTGFQEMLDGRVKTLHPVVHGGILARRDFEDHMQALESSKIKPIDLVCVNLYPFKETILKEGVKFEDAIENIDIGGPTMLRSAAKNFKDVTVITEVEDYERVLKEYQELGDTTLSTRQYLALKVFNTTAHYDALITDYLKTQTEEVVLSPLTKTYDLKETLRYGENPHQRAALYTSVGVEPWAMTSAHLLHGKQLSYNNIQDGQAALDLLQEFNEPSCVVVKHMNPCGVASASNHHDAFMKAYEADSISIFGGIVAINGLIDKETALVLNTIFLELVIATGFSDEAFEILSQKKNIRLLTYIEGQAQTQEMAKTIPGGYLVQDVDVTPVSEWVTATQISLDNEDLVFAQRVVKHVKSNAIVLVKDKQTVGIGAGQMNRVGAAQIAIDQAQEKVVGSVVGSDAFFPMRDTVDLLAKAGVKAIVQPGGSLKDQESIDACNEAQIAMLMTGVRHFKH